MDFLCFIKRLIQKFLNFFGFCKTEKEPAKKESFDKVFPDSFDVAPKPAPTPAPVFTPKPSFKLEIFSPCNGVLIDQRVINDETFAEGHMGVGLGIVPSDGHFKAFMEGELVVLYKTKHAYFIKEPKSGVNLMLHIGINTVEIDEDKNAFRTNRKVGEFLKPKEDLCEANLDVIRLEGKDITTALLIQRDEGMENKKVVYNRNPGDTVFAGDVLMTIVSE